MSHEPSPREWHYAEADRLLARAAEVTKEYVEISGKPDLNDSERDHQINVATLAGMLTRRANAHAQLARASEDVADDAISDATIRYKLADTLPALPEGSFT